jgi:hypothetical protein
MVAISVLGTRCFVRQRRSLRHCQPLSMPVPLTPVRVEFGARHKHQDILNICRASTNEGEPCWQWKRRKRRVHLSQISALNQCFAVLSRL